MRILGNLEGIPIVQLVNLEEALRLFTIPFLVEVRDWACLPENLCREMPFSEAVIVNPPVRLERGTVHPFVDMASVRPDARNVYPPEDREFRGGGSRFCSGDTLVARIIPCLENGKIARYIAKELGLSGVFAVC